MRRHSRSGISRSNDNQVVEDLGIASSGSGWGRAWQISAIRSINQPLGVKYSNYIRFRHRIDLIELIISLELTSTDGSHETLLVYNGLIGSFQLEPTKISDTGLVYSTSHRLFQIVNTFTYLPDITCWVDNINRPFVSAPTYILTEDGRLPGDNQGQVYIAPFIEPPVLSKSLIGSTMLLLRRRRSGLRPTPAPPLVSTYRNQGRWKEAEDLEVQVMETSERESERDVFYAGRSAERSRPPGGYGVCKRLSVSYILCTKRVESRCPEYPADQAQWQLFSCRTAPVGSAV